MSRRNSCTISATFRTVKAETAIPFFITGKLFEKTDPLLCKEVRDAHKPDIHAHTKYTWLLRMFSLCNFSSNNTEMVDKEPPEKKEHDFIK